MSNQKRGLVPLTASETVGDELPQVMDEIRTALGAIATTLTLYPSNGQPSEVVFHDDHLVDRSALDPLLRPATRPHPEVDAYRWTECTAETRCLDVLSFSVQSVPGHASLIISAFFEHPDRGMRRFAEEAYLSRRPFAIGYFRLWQLSRVRGRQAAALRETLSLSNTGTILVTRDYQVAYANAVAEALLEDGKSLRRNSDGTLAAVRIAESLRLQVALRHVIESDGAQSRRTAPIMSLRRDNGEVMVLSVLPVSDVGTESADIGAILYIHDPFVSTDRLMLPLCRLYGLSPTETRLTSLLVSGVPLEECAKTMRVAPQTARGYLKQLFQKTGTRRQADLIRLMLISLMHIDPSIELEVL